jgi:hypothetical protein
MGIIATIPEINTKLGELGTLFVEAPGLILTEEDLRCYLFIKLREVPFLRNNVSTADNEILSNYIHSEISWFDENGNLTIRPDITILEPENLSILNSIGNRMNLPRKGFHSTGNSILFELKFIRFKSGITKSVFNNQIKKDYEKMMRLLTHFHRTQPEKTLYAYLVVFSKYAKKCSEFISFEESFNHPNIKLVYYSGNIED